MGKKETVPLNEENKALAAEIGRIALKAATRARRAPDTETLLKLNVGVGLLNQAQMLIDRDDTQAKRLLSLSKGLINN